MISPHEHPIFNALDLESIIDLSIRSDAGPRWSIEDARTAADLYRSFLWLCWAYPDENIVPNSVIDQFWHLHILDTRRYADDCQKIFGRMLHHNPYLGLRDDQDKMHGSFARTLELVGRHFPEFIT